MNAKHYALLDARGAVVEIIAPAFRTEGEGDDAREVVIPIGERFHPDFVTTLVEYDPANPPVPPPPPPPAPPPPPSSVTMRQARLALLAAGKLGGVAGAISALPSPRKEVAQIEWEFASTVERGSPLTALLSVSLGMDEADLDQLFARAAAL